MAFFSLAALSLPGQGPSSLLPDGPEYKDVDGWSVKPTPREQLPEFLAVMMDEANPPLDPAEVTELLAMKHKKDKDDKEKKGKLVNSGGQLAWIEKKKLGVCACAPALSSTHLTAPPSLHTHVLASRHGAHSSIVPPSNQQ